MSDAPAADPLAPGTTVTITGGPSPVLIGKTAVVVDPAVACLPINEGEVILLIADDPVSPPLPPELAVDRVFNAVANQADVTAV